MTLIFSMVIYIAGVVIIALLVKREVDTHNDN